MHFIANAFNESTLIYIAWKLTELLNICGMDYTEKILWNGLFLCENLILFIFSYSYFLKLLLDEFIFPVYFKELMLFSKK